MKKYSSLSPPANVFDFMSRSQASSSMAENESVKNRVADMTANFQVNANPTFNRGNNG